MDTNKIPNHQVTAHSASTLDKIRKVPIGGKLADIEKTFDRLHTKEDIKQDVYLNLLTMTDDRFNDLLNKKKLLQYIGRTAKFMT